MKLSRKVLSTIVLTAVSLLTLNTAIAARLEDLSGRSVSEINKQHGPAVRGLSAQARARRYAEVLSLDADSALTLFNSSELKTGNHYRYQQLFRGIPVYGAVVVVSEDLDGSLRSLGGDLAQDIETDLTSVEATISPQQALAIAKGDALSNRPASASVENEKAEKTIYIDGKGTAHLTYKTSFYSVLPDGRDSIAPTFIIDANTGETLERWDEVKHANATGPGGNQKTGQYEYGTQRGYLDVAQAGTTCTMENAKVRTIDLNGGTTGSTAFSFTCPRNTVRTINGAYSPLNDAHYYGSVVHDMFTTYAAVAPWATKIVLRAHFGTNIDNAEYTNLQVNIGDGNTTTSYPLAVLDVVGHEIAHGFTARYSSLSSNGQSAAIDEAFSDMAGEAAEYFMQGTNNWELGRASVRGTGTIRYICTPKLDNNSIDHASNYVDTLPSHYAAGVYNKAFCLLAKKTNWNTRKAFEVFALANRTRWSIRTQFNNGACGVELAATDFGYSKADVTAAFASVGVSCGITWDPSTAIRLYSGGDPVFSNSNKTVATGTEPPNGLYGFAAVGTVAKNSGKRYLEFKFTRLRYGSVCAGCGTMTLTLRTAGTTGQYPDNDWGFTIFIVGYVPEDDQYVPSILIPPWDYISALSNWDVHEGDTIGLAADLTAGKLWFSLNGVWVGSPATGGSPVFDQSAHGAAQQISGKSVVPRVNPEFGDFEVTIRGSTGEFVYPVPSGFVPWTN